MAESLSQRQLEILWHTLGLTPERRDSYRNYFVASEGHHDIIVLRELECMGLMAVARSPSFLGKDDITFMATGVGKSLALAYLPFPPPPQSRTQHRQWLDADSGYSFGEWLCGHQLPKVEREATHAVVDGRYRCTPRYRMYRLEANSQWRREIEGDWAPTKKAAKASYKAALKAALKAARQNKETK